ncbi:MAG: DUF512 domain-containing protein [Bacillota bacterium]
MKGQQGRTIQHVAAGSPAAAAGISAGERLLRIDNRPPGDIIDYKIAETDERLALLLLSRDGRLKRRTICKDAATPLGLSFDPPTIAPLRRCGNRCLFCFIRQNPRGLRPSLYLQDDDYRLSFLYGNFITLNNMSDADLRRVIRLRLSPLYISVHATDSAVRRRLFGTARADQGLQNLHALVRAGIKVHLQIVLCPGYNTGVVFKKTVADLFRLGEAVLSAAAVPVGLTAHRRAGGPPLRRLEPDEARLLVRQVHRWQRLFLRARGSRFIFLADEIYALASLPFPHTAAYEGFPQLENGVGLARQFLDELTALPEPTLDRPLQRPFQATLVTGQQAAPLLRRAARRFNEAPGVKLRVAVLENRFFGAPVTAAGLLTGSDLTAGLKGRPLGEAVFIARSLLKEGSNLFLDGLTVPDLEESLGLPVHAVSGPYELAGRLRELNSGAALSHRSQRKESGT